MAMMTKWVGGAERKREDEVEEEEEGSEQVRVVGSGEGEGRNLRAPRVGVKMTLIPLHAALHS